MSNSVKTKFAGMLRGLLRRLDDDEAAAPQAPRSHIITVPPSTVAPAAGAFPRTAPSAASVSSAPMTPAAPAANMPAGSAENPDELQLPLQSILAAMPMDLRAKVIQTPQPGAVISIPLNKILTQLAFGSVKISFGELREAIPSLFVNSGGEHDHKTVTLPLNEILTRLNPARLTRRTEQKHLEVADEIAGPFGAGGQGAKISVGTKPTPSTALTSRAATTPQSLRMVAPAAPPTPAQPTPVAPPPPAFVPRAITPAPGGAAPPLSPMSHDTTSLFVSDLATPRNNGAAKAFAPAPPPAAPVPPPAAPAPVAAVPVPPPVVPVAPPVAPVPRVTTPVPSRAAPAPALAATAPTETAVISAPLNALAEHWPEGLRLEIIQSNLADAQVLLPANLIEPALKRGRITFAWRNLRPLIQPTPPPASVHDGIELELPLSVIAPLFFARQKSATRTQSATRPPTEIPNLFFGFPQPQSPSPEAPVKMPASPPVQPAPEPPPVVRAVPPPPAVRPEPELPPVRPVFKPVDAKVVDSNYYIWGDDTEVVRSDETQYKRNPRPATDFTSRHATPKEIVERAMALPGVVGALVALPDGLRVASQVPADLNADTLAAFLPQIFDRVGQSTKELRMGSLNNFNFTVGNVPWRIFRVNAVYFAAFGTAGEALPSAQLAALAAELDRKK